MIDLHERGRQRKPRENVLQHQGMVLTGIPIKPARRANVCEPIVRTLAPEQPSSTPERHPGARGDGNAASGRCIAAEEVHEGQEKGQKRDGAPEKDQFAARVQ